MTVEANELHTFATLSLKEVRAKEYISFHYSDYLPAPQPTTALFQLMRRRCEKGHSIGYGHKLSLEERTQLLAYAKLIFINNPTQEDWNLIREADQLCDFPTAALLISINKLDHEQMRPKLDAEFQELKAEIQTKLRDKAKRRIETAISESKARPSQ